MWGSETFPISIERFDDCYSATPTEIRQLAMGANPPRVAR